MGINTTSLKFILYCKNKFGINFSNTATIGRQSIIWYSPEESIFKRTPKRLRNFITSKLGIDGLKLMQNKYCEELFAFLGASAVDSFDCSSYEDVSIIHDFNTPIPDAYKEGYDFVFDGGSSEHIFNTPIVFKNIIDLIKINGFAICIVPTNCQSGHGFYQFSPEFFFSIFSESNGCEVKIAAYAKESNMHVNDLWIIENPKEVGRRVMIDTKVPTLIHVCVQKKHNVQSLYIPQQSDYAEKTWHGHNGFHSEFHLPTKKISKIIPKRIKRYITSSFLYRVYHCARVNIAIKRKSFQLKRKIVF